MKLMYEQQKATDCTTEKKCYECVKKDWGNGTRDFAAKGKWPPIGVFHITWTDTRLTVGKAAFPR